MGTMGTMATKMNMVMEKMMSTTTTTTINNMAMGNTRLLVPRYVLGRMR